MRLSIGPRTYDLGTRSLVLGAVVGAADWAPPGRHGPGIDVVLHRSERHLEAGADLLEVGAADAAGGPVTTTAREVEAVVTLVEALRRRFDAPITIRTCRPDLAGAALAAGAGVANEVGGRGDPAYLGATAAARASVILTHAGPARRSVAPGSGGAAVDATAVVAEVCDALLGAALAARAAGVAADRVVVDAGLDLGKDTPEALVLLRASDRLAGLGFPLLVSPPGFDDAGGPGRPGAAALLPAAGRGAALAAVALGAALGCRLVRTTDVRDARRVCDVVSAILGAP